MDDNTDEVEVGTKPSEEGDYTTRDAGADELVTEATAAQATDDDGGDEDDEEES